MGIPGRLVGWLSTLLNRRLPGEPFIAPDGPANIAYHEGARRMSVYVERLYGREFDYGVYSETIKQWDPPHETEEVDEAKRSEILCNVLRLLASWGRPMVIGAWPLKKITSGNWEFDTGKRRISIRMEQIDRRNEFVLYKSNFKKWLPPYQEEEMTDEDKEEIVEKVVALMATAGTIIHLQ